MQNKSGVRISTFEAALRFALDNHAAEVVHGWVLDRSSGPPRYIPRAWNELEGNIYDLTQHDQPISRELFYRKQRIHERGLKRYVVDEAAVMAVGTASCGPWDLELFDREELTLEEFAIRFGIALPGSRV